MKVVQIPKEHWINNSASSQRSKLIKNYINTCLSMPKVKKW